MPPKNESVVDKYMQWMTISMVWPAVTTALTEGEAITGLTLRGKVAFLIHQVRYFSVIGRVAAKSRQIMTLSQLGGLSTIPVPGDKGIIDWANWDVNGAHAGAMVMPIVHYFAPAYPFVGDRLYGYIATDVDDTDLDANTCQIQIGYTTAKLDDDTMKEVFDTWYRS